MITFEVNIEVIEFDNDKYNFNVAKNIERQMKIAGAAFLKAALKTVPIDTGFASGAFINLRFALQEEGKILDNLFKRLAKKNKEQKKFTPEELRRLDSNRETIQQNKERLVKQQFYRGAGGKIPKNPVIGRQFGTPADKIFTISKQGVYTFHFSVNIDYFIIQDVQNIGRSPSAPWRSFQNGIAAFSRHMLTTEVLKEVFPTLEEFFVKKIYKVDSGGGISIIKKEPIVVTRRGVL